MNVLVTMSAKAASLGDMRGVILGTIEENAPRNLLLEVTSQTKIAAAVRQHTGIDRPMRHVANNASFPQGFVFVDERTFLSRVTLEANVVLGKNTGAPPHDSISLVHIVTIHAAHFAPQYRMGVRQAELTTLVRMALEASLGGSLWIDDGPLRRSISSATRRNMQTPRTVARLATRPFGVLALRLMLGVICGFETLDDVLMARGAGIRPHEGGAWNLRRRHNDVIECGARNDEHGNQQGHKHRAEISKTRIRLVTGRKRELRCHRFVEIRCCAVLSRLHANAS